MVVMTSVLRAALRRAFLLKPLDVLKQGGCRLQLHHPDVVQMK